MQIFPGPPFRDAIERADPETEVARFQRPANVASATPAHLRLFGFTGGGSRKLFVVGGVIWSIVGLEYAYEKYS